MSLPAVNLWAAYLCLVLIVAGWMMLFGKPITTGLGRYRYQGRHWPRRVQPHEHRAHLILDGVAYCQCGMTRRLADGNYPQPE